MQTLCYTEIEEFSEAEIQMRNTMDYQGSEIEAEHLLKRERHIS